MRAATPDTTEGDKTVEMRFAIEDDSFAGDIELPDCYFDARYKAGSKSVKTSDLA